MGGNGKGIEPIVMSFHIDFIKAEAALRLGIGTPDDAKEYMVQGITKSIARVKAMGASLSQTVPESLVTPTLSYTIFVGNLYDASSDKLDVVMKEYYLALFGTESRLITSIAEPAHRRTFSLCWPSTVEKFCHVAYISCDLCQPQRIGNAKNRWISESFLG